MDDTDHHDGDNQPETKIPDCPLCLTPLDNTERAFKPCPCGYQMCTFCWDRVSSEKCPACRRLYNPESYTWIEVSSTSQRPCDKKQKSKKTSLGPVINDLESKKSLSTIRVVQRNLVYVTNLALSIAKEEILRRHEYFGQYGKIIKMAVNRSNVYQGTSVSCYVTYSLPEEAYRCIEMIDGCELNDRTLHASFGTTKYCSYFLRNKPCTNSDCMYLHSLSNEKDNFTKEEMQAGKHLLRLTTITPSGQAYRNVENSSGSKQGLPTPPKSLPKVVNRTSPVNLLPPPPPQTSPSLISSTTQKTKLSAASIITNSNQPKQSVSESAWNFPNRLTVNLSDSSKREDSQSSSSSNTPLNNTTAHTATDTVSTSIVNTTVRRTRNYTSNYYLPLKPNTYVNTHDFPSPMNQPTTESTRNSSATALSNTLNRQLWKTKFCRYIPKQTSPPFTAVEQSQSPHASNSTSNLSEDASALNDTVHQNQTQQSLVGFSQHLGNVLDDFNDNTKTSEQQVSGVITKEEPKNPPALPGDEDGVFSKTTMATNHLQDSVFIPNADVKPIRHEAVCCDNRSKGMISTTGTVSNTPPAKSSTLTHFNHISNFDVFHFPALPPSTAWKKHYPTMQIGTNHTETESLHLPKKMVTEAMNLAPPTPDIRHHNIGHPLDVSPQGTITIHRHEMNIRTGHPKKSTTTIQRPLSVSSDSSNKKCSSQHHEQASEESSSQYVLANDKYLANNDHPSTCPSDGEQTYSNFPSKNQPPNSNIYNTFDLDPASGRQGISALSTIKTIGTYDKGLLDETNQNANLTADIDGAQQPSILQEHRPSMLLGSMHQFQNKVSYARNISIEDELAASLNCSSIHPPSELDIQSPGLVTNHGNALHSQRLAAMPINLQCDNSLAYYNNSYLSSIVGNDNTITHHNNIKCDRQMKLERLKDGLNANIKAETGIEVSNFQLSAGTNGDHSFLDPTLEVPTSSTIAQKSNNQLLNNSPMASQSKSHILDHCGNNYSSSLSDFFLSSHPSYYHGQNTYPTNYNQSVLSLSSISSSMSYPSTSSGTTTSLFSQIPPTLHTENMLTSSTYPSHPQPIDQNLYNHVKSVDSSSLPSDVITNSGNVYLSRMNSPRLDHWAQASSGDNQSSTTLDDMMYLWTPFGSTASSPLFVHPLQATPSFFSNSQQSSSSPNFPLLPSQHVPYTQEKTSMNESNKDNLINNSTITSIDNYNTTSISLSSIYPPDSLVLNMPTTCNASTNSLQKKSLSLSSLFPGDTTSTSITKHPPMHSQHYQAEHKLQASLKSKSKEQICSSLLVLFPNANVNFPQVFDHPPSSSHLAMAVNPLDSTNSDSNQTPIMYANHVPTQSSSSGTLLPNITQNPYSTLAIAPNYKSGYSPTQELQRQYQQLLQFQKRRQHLHQQNILNGLSPSSLYDERSAMSSSVTLPNPNILSDPLLKVTAAGLYHSHNNLVNSNSWNSTSPLISSSGTMSIYPAAPIPNTNTFHISPGAPSSCTSSTKDYRSSNIQQQPSMLSWHNPQVSSINTPSTICLDKGKNTISNSNCVGGELHASHIEAGSGANLTFSLMPIRQVNLPPTSLTTLGQQQGQSILHSLCGTYQQSESTTTHGPPTEQIPYDASPMTTQLGEIDATTGSHLTHQTLLNP